MHQIKCRCGQSSQNFTHLRPQDLPNGWENECCPPEVEQKAPEAQEASEEIPSEKPVESKAQRKAREKAEREAAQKAKALE